MGPVGDTYRVSLLSPTYTWPVYPCYTQSCLSFPLAAEAAALRIKKHWCDKIFDSTKAWPVGAEGHGLGFGFRVREATCTGLRGAISRNSQYLEWLPVNGGP